MVRNELKFASPRMLKGRVPGHPKKVPKRVLVVDPQGKHDSVCRLFRGQHLIPTVVASAEEAFAESDAGLLGVILVDLESTRRVHQQLLALRRYGVFDALPVLALVSDDASGPSVRRLYHGAARQVFHWPREVLILQTLLPVVLGVDQKPSADGEIASALSRAIEDRIRVALGRTKVKVLEIGGHVRVGGTVRSRGSRQQLSDIVAQIPGVQSVCIEGVSVRKPASRSRPSRTKRRDRSTHLGALTP